MLVKSDSLMPDQEGEKGVKRNIMWDLCFDFWLVDVILS